MQKTGLFEMLPQLLQSKVYVGISAGSMIMGPEDLAIQGSSINSIASGNSSYLNPEYDMLRPNGQSSTKMLHLTEFSIRPHLNNPDFPNVTAEVLQGQIAPQIAYPSYALDDQSAVKINGNQVQVVSKGEWLLIEPGGNSRN